MKTLRVLLSLAALLGVLSGTAQATPFWTEAQLDSARAAMAAVTESRHAETGMRTQSSSLDDIAYFVKYRQLCDFLAGLQVTSTGQNFGGMREGEVGGDFSIIQTDNTQEAIRVWSQYAIWTGDTARYSQNIRDAWIYCGVWPAWREEGGGYYAMHNCGWGFEAAAKFREAYTDTSKNWYADSCALWVVANPLTLNGTLNYAAQGLGIGGLYPHAVYRNRADWQDHALTRARLIRNWFQADPNRLNTATEWALCAGTALWGVCNSLWIADPDSGATWIAQYGENLETWETASNWYNAYNTWYSNATFRCWEITGDSLYWNRGVFYADSLVGFDEDDDGGIPPGTCCIGNGNDHSWVSAYMGWMGLERIISSGPILIAGVQGLLSPDTARPLLELDSAGVEVRVANMGTDTVIAYLTMYGVQSYGADSQFALAPGEARDVRWNHAWHFPEVDDLPGDTLWMQVILDYWGTSQDTDTTTEEYFFNFDLRRRTNVFGTISGSHDFNGLPCRIDFYAAEFPDSVWTSVDVAANGQYTSGPRPLLEGSNRMIITPPPRYLIEGRSFVTVADNADPFDIWLTTSEVVLVDDDLGEDYETYLTNSLDELEYRTRVIDRLAVAELDLQDVEKLVWMTGNDSVTTLDASDRELLESYLYNGGGLILTGQNITDDPANAEFLEDVLLCQPNRHDTNRPRAYGIGGYPPVEGQYLLLLGSQGAANQSSPSSLLPLDGATAIFINDSTDEEICGVYGIHGSGPFIFLSFGLEAASGQAGSTTRAQFLEVALNSLSIPVAPPEPGLPTSYQLLPAYPNPFNSGVRIEWHAPINAHATQIAIYDILGREVTLLTEFDSYAGLHRAYWDGSSSTGQQVSSGTYFVKLTAPDVSQVQTLRLIR